MKRATLAVLVLAAAAAVLPAPAMAQLRVPQVSVTGGTLETYLTGVGESIDVDNAQLNIQHWKSTISGNSAMTLQITASANMANNSIGVYNAGQAVTTHFPIFPAGTPAGWFVVASFRLPDFVHPTTRLIVSLFDANGAPQGGPITYLNVMTTDFGYYIDNGTSKGYSQDARQDVTNEARVLTFAGTNENTGNWWVCFEDATQPDDDNEKRDFDDAVVFVESINPTPVTKSTWAAVKARFR